MEILERLGVAMMIGLLIGAERGWHDRSAERGSRPAGVRTFGVIVPLRPHVRRLTRIEASTIDPIAHATANDLINFVEPEPRSQ